MNHAILDTKNKEWSSSTNDK